MEDRRLPPEEEHIKRKVLGMAHTWEVWTDCIDCNDLGFIEIFIDAHIVIETCDTCHGFCGTWEWEVDE